MFGMSKETAEFINGAARYVMEGGRRQGTRRQGDRGTRGGKRRIA